MADFNEVDELDIEVAWNGIDPSDWRNRPDPPDSELENDEDHPTSKDVVSLLGYDPDDEGWDDDEDGPSGEKVFCPTGPGGGVDATCSPGKAAGYTVPQKTASGYVPGTVGAFSGVDTSSWKADHPVSQKIMKKIAILEEAAAAGKWHTFTKNMSGASPEASSSKLLKTLLTAQKNLLEKKNQKINSLPVGAEPAKAAPKPYEMDLSDMYTQHPEMAPPGWKPKPEPVPPLVADGATWKKIGPQLGTEKGGTYEMGGKKYYVKTPADQDRAINEVLTNKLYQLAGAGTRESHLIEMDGKKAVASEWVETNGTGKIDFNDKANQIKAQEDFAAHVWLNNRDAIGAGFENPEMNIIADKDGNFKIIDTGGGLDYKGMGGGGKKEFGYDVTSEWNSMTNSDINPTMAKVFGGMTDQQKVDSISKLDHINQDMIHKLVEGTGKDTKIAYRLIGRLAKLRDLRDELVKKIQPPPAIAPVLTGWDKFKLSPVEVPVAPSFITKNADILKENLDLVDKITNASLKGDLDGVEKIAVMSKSPKVIQYANETAAAMQAKAHNPLPVNASAKKTLVSIDDKIQSSDGKEGLKKIGFYSLIDSIPEHKISEVLVSPKKTAAPWKLGKTHYDSQDYDTKSSLRNYTGSGYHDMNSSLRKGKPTEAALRVATAVMKGPYLKPGQQLIRKHNLDSDGLEELNKLPVGSVIQEKGVLSTSTKPGVWGGKVKLNITIGPKVRGLPAKSFSHHPGEHEVLLPPNSKFLITQKEKSSYGATIHVLVLPTTEDQCCPP